MLSQVLCFERTSASIALRFLSPNNRIGYNFARGRYAPTVSFLLVTLDPEVSAIRFAPGHIRIRRPSRIACFNSLVHPTRLFFCKMNSIYYLTTTKTQKHIFNEEDIDRYYRYFY